MADGSTYDPATGAVTPATIDQSYKPPTASQYQGPAGYYHPADTALQERIAEMQRQVYQQSTKPELAATVKAPEPPKDAFYTPLVQSPSGQYQSVSGGSNLYQQYAQQQPGVAPSYASAGTQTYGKTLTLPSGQQISPTDPNYKVLAQQIGVLQAGMNYEPGKVSAEHKPFSGTTVDLSNYDPNSIIWTSPTTGYGIPIQKATLVDPKTGARVAVVVGSDQAQQYFGQGYVLDKGDGTTYDVTGAGSKAVVPGASMVNSPTGGFQNQGAEGVPDTGTTEVYDSPTSPGGSSAFQSFLASIGMGGATDPSAFQAPTGAGNAQSQIDAMLAEYKAKLGQGLIPTAEEQQIAEQLASIAAQEEKLTAEPYQQHAARIQAEQEAITRGELTPVIAGQTNAIARRQALQALTSQAQLASLKAQAIPLQAKLAALQAQRKASTDVAVDLFNAQYKAAQDAIDNNRADAAAKLDALNSFLSNQNMQRDDARMVMKDMLSTFGTKAFDGVTAEAIRNLETKAGYPTGTISSGLQTLKEAEAAAKAAGVKPDLREVGGNLYSIAYDPATGKYTPTLVLSKGTTSGTRSGTSGGSLADEDPMMRLALRSWSESNPGELYPSNKTVRADILSAYVAENVLSPGAYDLPTGVSGPVIDDTNPFTSKGREL